MRWILVLLLLFPARLDASRLGLAPEPPRAPPLTIPTDLFARIDALYAVDDPDADTHFQLAFLHHATGLDKHLPATRDHLDRALDLDGDHLDARLLAARVEAEASDFAGALRILGTAPDPELAYARGYYRYLRARRTHDFSGFDTTRDAFLRAARGDRDSSRYRRALAAAGLLLEDAETVLAATSTLVEEGDSVAWLFRGCSLAGEGRDAEAGKAFRLGFDGLDPSILREFLDGGGLLVDADGRTLDARVYWRVLDPHPTRPTNRRQMEFWTRMIQADLLFGTADHPGWRTQTGQAWVRWGPPAASTYLPGDIQRFEGRTRPAPGRTAGTPLPPVDPMILKSDIDPRNHRSIWTWALGRDSFSLVFLDQTYAFRWSLSNLSQTVQREKLQQAPVVFVTEAPQLRVGLEVATYVFRRSESVLDLETAIEVDVPAGFILEAEPLRVDWSVFDARDRMVDTKHVLLGDEHRRSEILLALGLPLEEPHDPYVTQVAAHLPPGHDRVAVELTHEGTGQNRSKVVDVELAPAPPELSLSDVQLTSSWVEVGGGRQAPPEFVKHAHAVVPRLNPSVASGQRHIYTYFEIYHLSTDASGQTRFDVAYEVFSSQVPRAKRHAATALHRQVFLDERTAVSGNAAVIKGARLELTDLPGGGYTLRVTVTDHLGGGTVTHEAPFFVVAGL